MQARAPRMIFALLMVTTAAIASLAASFPAGSQAAARHAPCTKKALSAGLGRGAGKVPDGWIVGPYGCAGKYAYAAVEFDGNEGAVVFRAHGVHWFTVDRGHACEGDKVPSRIYAPACEYS